MTRARLFVHRFRRQLAAACAALAVILLASALRPTSPPVVDVIIAAADLPAGATLSVDDLDLRAVPREFAPPGGFAELSAAVGRTISSGMAAGEIVTETRLIATGARTDGLHTVPVRLADAETADLLAPGVTVDLVLPSGDSAAAQGRVIAEGVRVVTVPRPAQASGFGSPQRRAGSLIVVATDRRTAVALAAVGSQPGLGVVLR
ncbi:MAG: hypothetical protein RL347_1424 [Actinomycetota bacterium]|jgi:Flp pilus assembly protein CpaB